MGTESFLAIICAAMIAMLFGTVLAFSGYRLFMILLPIWGFFFGFALGAQTIQAIFGGGFLSTVTGWIVGFFVALLFAALSYLFYFLAVVLIAGSLGYAIGVGLVTLFMDYGLVAWLVGIVFAIGLAIITVVFNLQKWVIVIATAVLGAATIVATIVYVFNPSAITLGNPVQSVLGAGWWWVLIFLVIAVLGGIAQIRQTNTFTIEEYNRWEEA
jgi:hypothetical protein